MPPPSPCLIYHFTPLENLAAVLSAGGLHCKAQAHPSSDISDAGIQARRARRRVEAGPGGVLHDYVPFYFAPRSPMLHRLYKQDSAEQTQVQSQLVYLVSSAERVAELGLPFAFTDGHAEMRVDVHYYDRLSDLSRLDWRILRASGWNSDEERRKRQAEFLVHDFAPLGLFLGYAVANTKVADAVAHTLSGAGVMLRGKVRRDWYYGT